MGDSSLLTYSLFYAVMLIDFIVEGFKWRLGTVAHRGHAANRIIAVTSFKLQKLYYFAVIKVILLQVIYKIAASYI